MHLKTTQPTKTQVTSVKWIISALESLKKFQFGLERIQEMCP